MENENNPKGSNSNIPRKPSKNYSEDNEFDELERLEAEESGVVYEKDEADWWKEKMKRRDATKKVVGVGIGAVLLSYVAFRGCSEDEEDIDPDETETNVDALSLQQKEGWNAGHSSKVLEYKDVKDFNSLGNNDYTAKLNLNSLLDQWKPKSEKFLPYFVPTLLQVTDNTNFTSTLKPVCNDQMVNAYAKGLGFKEIVTKSKDFQKVLIISDLSGPESVAFAASVSDICVPVITFDNWPHPLGIVPAHQTLGALVYYGDEVKEKSQKLTDDSPLLMVLDRNRFKQNINPDTDFDNRYMAKIPTLDNMKKLGITSVMYVVDNNTTELDDLNDDFASFKENGINVSLMDLSNFQKDSTATDSTKVNQVAGQASNPNAHYYSNSAPVYYYGGHPSFMPFFFMHYSYVTPMRTYRTPGTMPSSIRQNNYSPVKRQTIFSSRNVSSASGIGRTRPTGFGSISTRMNRNTGRMTGIRTGRTGSFGRVSSFGRSS